MAALWLLALFPLCQGTPASLGTLGTFNYGGGASPATLGLSHAMMGMAARMMSMASRMAGHVPGQGLDRAGPAATHQAGWSPLPTAPGPGAFMAMLPPPLQGAVPLSEQMGKFMGVNPPGMPHVRGKARGEQPPMDGGMGMGMAPPPGGSSQLHLMEKLHGPAKDSGQVMSGEKLAPVGVGADYTYFAGQLAGGSTNNGLDPVHPQAAPISDTGLTHLNPNVTDLHYHNVMEAEGLSTPKPGQTQNLHPPPPPPPPHPVGPPTPEQLLMSNLFSMGSRKSGDHKQFIPQPDQAASKTRGLGPIPGLTAPLGTAPNAASNTADRALRAPCDLLVDAVFALDDMKNLWLARESIRYYETQLLPSRKTRFGVVLCGQAKSFYTALHQHFSALIASLEDLQHANATLDPAQHMPDTPGHRSDNNPYPPRVSEDFAQIDAGCLETAYHLLTYQSAPNADRLLTLVGTKERWGRQVAVEEARFLHSLNISLLTTADGALSPAAQDSLRKMASSPDKFRSVSDNVTLHALPAMIGSAICRPQKADVTVAVERTATGIIQDPVVTECHQLDPMTMQRTMDFGQFFGLHTDHVHCPPGLLPDLALCACV